MTKSNQISDSDYLKFGARNSVRRLRDIKLHRVASVVRTLDPGVVVDIGAADCAITSRLAGAFPGVRFIAVDRSERLLETCKDQRVEKIVGDARQLPLDDQSVDLALMVATFKHIFRADGAITELYRIVRPGGHVLIVEPSTAALRVGGAIGRFDLENSPNVWTVARYNAEFARFGFMAVEKGRFPFPGTLDSDKSCFSTLRKLFRVDRLAPFQMYLGQKAER